VFPARTAAALPGAAVFIGAPAAALELPDLDTFRDPVDGRLDASRWLLGRKGALPVPIVITEPAVGYGAGLGLVAEYDGRDNIFTPNSGLRAYAQAMKFDAALGSDHDFSRSRLGLNAYFPAGSSVVVGVRADARPTHPEASAVRPRG